MILDWCNDNIYNGHDKIKGNSIYIDLDYIIHI